MRPRMPASRSGARACVLVWPVRTFAFGAILQACMRNAINRPSAFRPARLLRSNRPFCTFRLACVNYAPILCMPLQRKQHTTNKKCVLACVCGQSDCVLYKPRIMRAHARRTRWPDVGGLRRRSRRRLNVVVLSPKCVHARARVHLSISFNM